MKYIITEEQNMVMHVLRRVDTDWPLIREIVDEGTDNDDPCDFRNLKSYMIRICNDSALTYLLHYFDSHNDKGYIALFPYIVKLIKERMGEEITDYYNEIKEDCD